MQTQYNIYLGGNLVPSPDNIEALMLELSFENGSPEEVLNATKLIWKGANAVIVNNWYNQGLTGGYGIFEGIPLLITVCDSNDVAFNGICDLTGQTKWNCDIVQVDIRDTRTDMVKQLFDSVTFTTLATCGTLLGGVSGTSVGPYTASVAGVRTAGLWINAQPEAMGGDYAEIIYQNNDIPDYAQFFMMVISIYEMVQQLVHITKLMISFVAGLILQFGTIVGALAIIADVLLLIGYILEIVAMIFVLIDLFEMALDYLVSPFQTKLAMRAITLLERACAYFGIQFSSTILENYPFNELCIMPSKRAWNINQNITRSVVMGTVTSYNSNQRMNYDEVYNFQHGGYADGYYDGTVNQLLHSLEDMFNAKAKVILNSSGQPVLYFERWDYFYDLANYQLPNVSQQAPFAQDYTTNAADIAANYMVRWATDNSDMNTYNDNDGSSCYYQVAPKVISNPLNVTLKNLKEIDFEFSHATKKDQLTAVESIFNDVWNDFISIPNAISSAINSGTHAINQILNIFGLPDIPSIPPIPGNPLGGQFGDCTPGQKCCNDNVMLLYNNITDTPKAFILGARVINMSNPIPGYNPVTGYAIAANNKGMCDMSQPNLSARALMRDFHYSSLVASVYPANAPWSGNNTSPGGDYYNQWRKYTDIDIPLCCSDYELIYNNNIIKDYNNNFGRVDSLKWNVYQGSATIDYRTNIPYTYNLQYSYIVDGVTNLLSL